MSLINELGKYIDKEHPKQLIKRGLAFDRDFTEEDADPDELAKGIKIESEHTVNKALAKEIALDHLAEMSDYYTKLEAMEKEAEAEGDMD
jgi:hypothetical protein